MAKVDLAKRRLMQLGGAIGSASMLGLSLSGQAATKESNLPLSDYEHWDMSAMSGLLRQENDILSG